MIAVPSTRAMQYVDGTPGPKHGGDKYLSYVYIVFSVLLLIAVLIGVTVRRYYLDIESKFTRVLFR